MFYQTLTTMQKSQPDFHQQPKKLKIHKKTLQKNKYVDDNDT